MVINHVMEKPQKYVSVDYDGLWKKLIYELFEEFVLFFASDLYEDINFQKRPEFLQQELFQEIIQEKKGKKVADQIVKVFLKSGEEKWLLIHIEVQGSLDPEFSKRMFRYYYRIFDKYDRDIVAIALLTDTTKSFRPDTYHRFSYGTALTYEFNMFKFGDYTESVLLQSNNPFAIAILAAKFANEVKNDTEKRYRFKLKLMRLVLKKSAYPQEERRILMTTLIYFIDYLLQIPIELTRKLRNEIILSKEESDMMYLDRNNLPPTFGELMKEEKELVTFEVKKRFALKLMKKNFSNEDIAELTDLSLEEVKKLRKS